MGGAQVGWDGASEDLQGGANSISQVDGVSDMAPACQLCGSVQEGSEKGQWPLSAFTSVRKLSCSSCLDVRHFSSSPYATGAFQVSTWCWSSEGVSLHKSLCGFFKRNELLVTPAVSSTNSVPAGFFQAGIMGTYLPGTGTLGWGPGVGLRLLASEISL